MEQEFQALIAPHDSQALLLPLVKSTFQKGIPHTSKLTKTFWLATTFESAGYYYLTDSATNTQLDFGQLIFKDYVRPRHFS